MSLLEGFRRTMRIKKGDVHIRDMCDFTTSENYDKYHQRNAACRCPECNCPPNKGPVLHVVSNPTFVVCTVMALTVIAASVAMLFYLYSATAEPPAPPAPVQHTVYNHVVAFPPPITDSRPTLTPSVGDVIQSLIDTLKSWNHTHNESSIDIDSIIGKLSGIKAELPASREAHSLLMQMKSNLSETAVSNDMMKINNKVENFIKSMMGSFMEEETETVTDSGQDRPAENTSLPASSSSTAFSLDDSSLDESPSPTDSLTDVLSESHFSRLPTTPRRPPVVVLLKEDAS